MALRKKTNSAEQTESPIAKAPSGVAAAFDSAAPSAGGFDFPVGEHEAVITEFVLVENEKGTSVKVAYTGSSGEAADKTISQYYNLANAEGEAGKGIGFLKRDLAILGFEDVKFEDLEETLNEVVDGEVGVLITVKQNGQYLNAYLAGTLD